MDNKKRAIMIPVMTLAVCAIAMVGLGFALQTSVTSNSNTVEKLMVDLDDDYVALDAQTDPDDENVDGIFNIEMKSDKKTLSGDATNTFTANFGVPYGTVVTTITSGETPSYTVTVDGNSATIIDGNTSNGTTTVTCTYGSNFYKTVFSGGKATTTATAITIDGGYAFIKIFGNVNTSSLKVTNSTTTKAVFTLYKVSYDSENNKISNISEMSPTSSKATLDDTTEATFTVPPTTKTTYLVAITQIGGSTGYNISYSADNAGKIIPTISGKLDSNELPTYNLTFTASS